MTLYRFGYVAMSMHVKNASPSKTMTYSQFSKPANRDAAVAKLERIASQNIHNCLRLLRHNEMHQIDFFRLSSKLIPLANHPELSDWHYIKALKRPLGEIKDFLKEYPKMRVDFHPDHFVVLNNKDKDILKMSLKTLQMHYHLLKGMGIDPMHRSVLHVGGSYENKLEALEQFICNWSYVPTPLQQMIILENDDKTFTLKDTLYLCEKLGIPSVFDYHHFLANHEPGATFEEDWPRVVQSWYGSKLPLKMHISSPKSEKDFRAHSDTIDLQMFWDFVEATKGTVEQIDVMIEAKLKDEALFQLMKDIKSEKKVQWVTATSFEIK